MLYYKDPTVYVVFWSPIFDYAQGMKPEPLTATRHNPIGVCST